MPGVAPFVVPGVAPFVVPGVAPFVRRPPVVCIVVGASQRGHRDASLPPRAPRRDSIPRPPPARTLHPRTVPSATPQNSRPDDVARARMSPVNSRAPPASDKFPSPTSRHARTTLHAALKPHPPSSLVLVVLVVLVVPPEHRDRAHPSGVVRHARRATGRVGSSVMRRCDDATRVDGPGVARVRPDVHRVSVAGGYDAPPRRGSVGGRESLPRRQRAAGRVERPRRGGAVHGRGHDEERASGGGVRWDRREREDGAGVRIAFQRHSRRRRQHRRFFRRGVDAPPSLWHPGRRWW